MDGELITTLSFVFYLFFHLVESEIILRVKYVLSVLVDSELRVLLPTNMLVKALQVETN